MPEMRGYLIAYKDGDIDLDEMEEKIIKFGFKQMSTGYEYGYIDGRFKRIENPRSDLLRAVKNVELTPIGTSVRTELLEQLREANKEG